MLPKIGAHWEFGPHLITKFNHAFPENSDPGVTKRPPPRRDQAEVHTRIRVHIFIHIACCAFRIFLSVKRFPHTVAQQIPPMGSGITMELPLHILRNISGVVRMRNVKAMQKANFVKLQIACPLRVPCVTGCRTIAA